MNKNYNNNKKHYLNNPWAKHLMWAKSRCRLSGDWNYYSRGIEVKMTTNEIKELWFKCGADKMKKPNLHRKKSSTDYTIDNCVFIEEAKHKTIHGKGMQGHYKGFSSCVKQKY